MRERPLGFTERRALLSHACTRSPTLQTAGMKALLLTSTDGTLEHREVDEPPSEKGSATVRMQAAALNRRDFWITQGLYPGIVAPCILGSDGSGEVIAVADEEDQEWIGREVLINPSLDWGPSQDAQGEDFSILGMPRNGTFAETVNVPVGQLVAKPAHLSAAEAAALPLAGLTAYRALFVKGGLQSGQTVLITGIGGGVAVIALKFAAAAGAKVLVTSSSDDKLARALTLGATAGANYKEDGWVERLAEEHGPIDLVLDGAAGAGFNALLALVRPGGRIVNYGGTAGPPPDLDIRKHFWKQLQLLGSTMGSPADFSAMTSFVAEHEIRPEVDSVRPLAEGAEVVASMANSPQFGKLVLEIA